MPGFNSIPLIKKGEIIMIIYICTADNEFTTCEKRMHISDTKRKVILHFCDNIVEISPKDKNCKHQEEYFISRVRMPLEEQYEKENNTKIS